MDRKIIQIADRILYEANDNYGSVRKSPKGYNGLSLGERIELAGELKKWGEFHILPPDYTWDEFEINDEGRDLYKHSSLTEFYLDKENERRLKELEIEVKEETLKSIKESRESTERANRTAKYAMGAAIASAAAAFLQIVIEIIYRWL